MSKRQVGDIKMLSIRLNKYIAEAGICSRRKADELIDNKSVKVNGIIAEKGTIINPEIDKVEVDGKIMKEELKSSNLDKKKLNNLLKKLNIEDKNQLIIFTIDEEGKDYFQ